MNLAAVQYDVLMAGDVMLATRSGMLSPFSPDIEDLCGRIPYSMVNLEVAISRAGESLEKAVVLRADPKMSEYLHKAGVKAVSVANNHVMDYGSDGFKGMCQALELSKIAYCGAMRRGVQRPCIFEIRGQTIGVLGYSMFGATESEKQHIAVFNRSTAERDIHRLKSEGVKRIIIHMHWGEEYVIYPSPEQQCIGRSLLDAGADVIIGHHPHVVQGVERYKNGVIFYSLGNFNFISSSDLGRAFPCTRWGLIVLLRFPQSSPVEYICLPVQINEEYQPCFPTDNKRKAFLAYLDRISEPLVPGIERWFWYRQAAVPHFRNHLPSFVRRIRRYGVHHLYQMIRWLISPSNYRFYLGLILRLVDSVFGRNLLIHCPDPSDVN